MGEKTEAAKQLEEAKETMSTLIQRGVKGPAVTSFGDLEKVLKSIIAAVEDIDRRLGDD